MVKTVMLDSIMANIDPEMSNDINLVNKLAAEHLISSAEPNQNCSESIFDPSNTTGMAVSRRTKTKKSFGSKGTPAARYRMSQNLDTTNYQLREKKRL